MKSDGFNTIVLITVCTLFGKVLGVLKDCLLSYYYGTTAETDAFFLAMSIPTLLLGTFTASTDSAIIPQYKRVMQKMSRVSADALFSMIVNSLSIIAGIACVFVFLWPTGFVKLFATGFSEENVILASNYLKIFAPIGVLHLWYCFFCTYTAAYKKNTARSILAFSTNLVVVLSLFFIRDRSLQLLSFAYLGSNIICAVLPLIEMRQLGYIYKFRWVHTKGEYKNFWILFLPIMGGALLNNLQQYVDKNLCSNIEGAISYLNYGNKMVNIFDSVFVVGLSVVIIPMLSDFEHTNEFKDFSKVVSKVTRLMVEVFVPCVAILFILSREFIVLLYGGGKFGADSVTNVSGVLQAYSLLILLTPLVTIFSKIFHVKEMNTIPFRVNLFGVLANVCLSVLFKTYWGVIGVAFATTVAIAIEMGVYIVLIFKFVQWDMAEIQFRKMVGVILPTVILPFLPTLYDTGLSTMALIIIKSLLIILFYLLSYWAFLRDDMNFWIDKGKALLGR